MQPLRSKSQSEHRKKKNCFLRSRGNAPICWLSDANFSHWLRLFERASERTTRRNNCGVVRSNHARSPGFDLTILCRVDLAIGCTLPSEKPSVSPDLSILPDRVRIVAVVVLAFLRCWHYWATRVLAVITQPSTDVLIKEALQILQIGFLYYASGSREHALWAEKMGHRARCLISRRGHRMHYW